MASSKSSDAYRALIAAYADKHPWGFRSAAQVEISVEDLGSVIAHDNGPLTEALRNSTCIAKMADQLNAAELPECVEAALGAVLLPYVQFYANALVFEDLRNELDRRGEAEEARLEAERRVGSSAYYARAMEDLDRVAAL